MTGTDIREALHEIADSTPAPTPDRLAFQRQVRRERRALLGGRAALAVGVIAASAALVATFAPFVPSSLAPDPAPAGPAPTGTTDLQAPVHVVADGRMVAVDPQGHRHDLGPAEEVVGWTSEVVYYVDADSNVVRRALTNSDEGPGSWSWSDRELVVGPVQSTQLSADGRFLGWVDLAERLHVQDLKAGTTAAPVPLEGSGYLVDLAQGSGTPLVSDDRGLTLLTPDGPLSVPGSRHAWDSSATRELVAVVGPDETLVFRLDQSRVRTLDSVPGFARLSPYGDTLASVDDDRAWVWPADGERVRLDVPGDASRVAWGDDDTVLVSTFLDRQIGVYACDVATAGEPCAALDVGTPQSVRLAR